MKISIIFYFLSICLFVGLDGYKFLIYSPKVGRSRIGFYGKLADILVDAGHDVTVYEPTIEVNLSSKGIGSKKAKMVERPCDFEVLFNSDEAQGDVWSIEPLGLFAFQKRLHSFFLTLKNLCQSQLNDQNLMEKLKNEHFDVAFGDVFDPCFFGLVEKLEIKTHITVFATTVYDNLIGRLGVPATPSFAPVTILYDPVPMDYLTRAKNLFILAMMNLYFPLTSHVENVIQDHFGVEKFDVMERAADSAFIFTNADEHTDYSRPITHKIVYIGGLGLGKAKTLEKKYEEIFTSAKKGVIFVSFGSVAQSYRMPQEMKKNFLETFAKFHDVNFIWKYERDEDNIAEGYPNVFTFKWLPQTDLLEHPRLLAFISHGGMNSVTEGSSRGVPMVCIPLFAEQLRNANLLQYRGTAVVVEKKDLMNGEVLEAAINEILINDKYRNNAKRLSAMIRAKPMSPEERVIKYSEFAAEFGPNNNLNMEGRHLNFIQFYCLDIIVPFILLVIVLLFIVVQLAKFIVRKILGVFVGKSKVE